MAKNSPIGRVSFEHVFEANEYEGKRNFELALLFDKKDVDLSEMKAEANRVAKEKWGDKLPSKFTSPFRDGDEKDDRPEYIGMNYIRFKRPEKKGPPQVVGPNPKDHLTQGSGAFYSGCYGRVSYTCFAWETGKNAGGVSFALNNVQKVRDGEPLDGRTNADDDFDALEEVTEGADLF
jgi:hypothetical protein